MKIKDAATGEWQEVIALQGKPGPSGSPGPVGPNAVSYTTDSAITGLLKGADGKVTQANDMNTTDNSGDYVSPAVLMTVLDNYSVKPTSTTVVLPAAGWQQTAQAITVPGMRSNKLAMICPDPASFQTYRDNGVFCRIQGYNSLTFACDTTPQQDITMNVIIWG